jgi:hypothetical protein
MGNIVLSFSKSQFSTGGYHPVKKIELVREIARTANLTQTQAPRLSKPPSTSSRTR